MADKKARVKCLNEMPHLSKGDSRPFIQKLFIDNAFDNPILVTHLRLFTCFKMDDGWASKTQVFFDGQTFDVNYLRLFMVGMWGRHGKGETNHACG